MRAYHSNAGPDVAPAGVFNHSKQQRPVAGSRPPKPDNTVPGDRCGLGRAVGSGPLAEMAIVEEQKPRQKPPGLLQEREGRKVRL